MWALLRRVPDLSELEAGESDPGNATESGKLGQSSRVRQGHSGSKKGGGLSIVESSSVPMQGGRPVASAARLTLKLYLNRELQFGSNKPSGF